MKTKQILILSVIGVALVTSLLCFLRPSQPEYKGVPLSTWLSRYADAPSNPQKLEAQQAIQNIGTNAIPLLLKWIDYEWPVWLRKMDRYTPWLFNPRTTKAFNSGLGFAVLGTNAASAVQVLTKLMNDTNRPASRNRAIYALCGIGTPALPSLAAALRNKDPDVTFLYDWATNVSQPRSIHINPPQYMKFFVIGTNAMTRLATNLSTNALPAQGTQ